MDASTEPARSTNMTKTDKTDTSTNANKTDGSTNAKTETSTNATLSRRKKPPIAAQYYRKLRTLLGFEGHDVTKERRPQWSIGRRNNGENFNLNNQFVYPRGHRKVTIPQKTCNPTKIRNTCESVQPRAGLYKCYSGNNFI